MTAVAHSDKQRPKRLFAIRVMHKGDLVQIFDFFTDSMTAMEQVMDCYPQASSISVRLAMPLQGDGALGGVC